jgi:hypothetical protein
MKSVRWFSLLVALVTVCLLLTACSQNDTNSATPSGEPPPAAGSNLSSANSPNVPANVPPSPYQGAVDRRDCDVVAGWAKNKTSQAETKVELYIDDKLIDTAPATTLRPDLTSWGTGRYGFSFKMPAAYKDGAPHTVRIKVAGTDFAVPFYQTAPGFVCTAP